MDSKRNSDDGKYREAFGEHTGITQQCREEINLIKRNDPGLTSFPLRGHDASKFSDLAWQLLGGLIANNSRLESVHAMGSQLTDSKISILFRGLAKDSPLKNIDLERNGLGIDGIRSMVPFLSNARSLTTRLISEKIATSTRNAST